MNDRQLAHLSAIASLNDMMRKGTFYISTVTEVAKAIGAVPDPRAMDILRPLHCMEIGRLPPELRDAIPALIERCIGTPAYQFSAHQADNPALVQAGTVRMLTRGAA